VRLAKRRSHAFVLGMATPKHEVVDMVVLQGGGFELGPSSQGPQSLDGSGLAGWTLTHSWKKLAAPCRFLLAADRPNDLPRASRG